MSNETQNKNQELTVKFDIDGNEIKLTPKIVQEYIVGTDVPITNQEFKLFTELCKVRKLNPFLREAYLIKYKAEAPAQLVVGKDAILKRAVLNANYDGTVKKRRGTFKLEEEKLVGGWARVFRKDWTHPTYSSVTFSEVAQKTKQGQLNSNWDGKGATMVEKVAKVRALRETFVEDLAGMYEAEEMQQEELPVQDAIEVQEDVIEQEETTKEVSMNEL